LIDAISPVIVIDFDVQTAPFTEIVTVVVTGAFFVG
jgi:hypothetical protein